MSNLKIILAAAIAVFSVSAYSQQVITCSSDEGTRHTCSADVRGGVELTNQRSGSACQRGHSWGTDRDGIWVDHGCRADFTIRPYSPYVNQAGRAGLINCSSDDGERHNCPADTSGGVLMVDQRSGSPCTRGYSWGEDQNSIWVDHGCRADFQTGNSGGGGYPTSAVITCASDDGRHTCDVDTNGGVRLVRQISGAECRRGYSWGADDDGIWVDHGCRGEFQVGSRRH